jgi:hypothetical protein
MRPTDDATAVATGLCRTGRAAQHTERVGNVLRLARWDGGYYWISFDGAELRLGETLLDAEPLQSTFIAAMARVGRAPKESPTQRHGGAASSSLPLPLRHPNEKPPRH